jgi:hypothetical protein
MLQHEALNISNYALGMYEFDEISLQKKIEYKNYTMMDFFYKNKVYYYPSCFIRNEFLIDTNFSYKSLNCTFYFEMGMESERDFLIRLSGTLLDLMRSNKENIAYLQKFID